MGVYNIYITPFLDKAMSTSLDRNIVRQTDRHTPTSICVCDVQIYAILVSEELTEQSFVSF